MHMKAFTISTKPARRKYFIQAPNGADVCWFDDVYTAAVVLRFLTGNVLSKEDAAIARAALIAFDKEDKRNDTEQRTGAASAIDTADKESGSAGGGDS